MGSPVTGRARACGAGGCRQALAIGGQASFAGPVPARRRRLRYATGSWCFAAAPVLQARSLSENSLADAGRSLIHSRA